MSISAKILAFHVVTLFPDAFRSYLGESILKRAIEDGKIVVKFYNPRDYTADKHKRIDRAPYGGGPGMVIQAEPVIRALEKAYSNIHRNVGMSKKLKTESYTLKAPIIWLTPNGKQFTNTIAGRLAGHSGVIIICGRYEGIDARVKRVFKVEELSVGPFVLTGGELPAMVLIDVIARQVKGVLGNEGSREETRVASPDVYTRPEVIAYKGKKLHVPAVLLSGHHEKIEHWRRGRRSAR